MISQDPGPGDRTVVVVADTTVLVNLLHIDRTDLFARIPDYEFILPEEVVGEITDETQQAALKRAIADGLLRLITITDVGEIGIKAELSVRLGEGESALSRSPVRGVTPSPPMMSVRRARRPNCWAKDTFSPHRAYLFSRFGRS